MKWILFIARRFAQVDRSGRSAVTGFLASLSICFGVMTLIVVISVMNGFQLGFIDSIMEISSAHIRVEEKIENNESLFDFELLDSFCKNNKEIISFESFYEAQSLMVSEKGRQRASLIRAVSPDIIYNDLGFAKELNIISGVFSLASPDAIVLGSELARQLGVRVGDTVNLLALSGGSDVDLISDNSVFTVVGIFSCGYADINATYSFISLDAGEKLFGKDAKKIYAIKISNTDNDIRIINQLENEVPGVICESWRSYNRSFFGALRIEKNLLMMLVLLIFVVVGVNIFNGMRRMVFERKEEIAILSALGSKKKDVQLIFILRGLITGLSGAIPGLMIGLLLCVRMDAVFSIISKVSYWIQYFIVMLSSPDLAVFVKENPMYRIYAQIPARIMPFEVLFITIFGVFSALIASWIASKNIQTLSISEVLHDE